MEPPPGRRPASAWSLDPPGVLARGRPAATAEATREVPVQVNGKLRDRLVVPADTDAAALEALALASPKVVAALAGRTPDRVIAAGGGKLVNIVVRD